MSVSITFLGGAGTVTGSKSLVRPGGQSLLVDCGLFQGYKQLRLRNRDPLPVLPNRIGAVLLTHFLAERLRANPRVSSGLEKLAGVFLIGFGIKLALSK